MFSMACQVNGSFSLEQYPYKKNEHKLRSKGEHSPVRWSETMHLFKEKNITEFYECGPSKVLTGLIKKQFVNIALHSLDDIETLMSMQEN